MFLPAMVALALASGPGDPPIHVWLNSSYYSTGGDNARVYVRAAQDGYAVVLRVDTDRRIRLLFPVDPGDDAFIRGGKDAELRGRGDRDAFFVDDGEGTGVVFAAWSARPFVFERFVRGDHWDYRVLAPVPEGDDVEMALVDLVTTMSAGSHFDYDIARYAVVSPYSSSGVGYHGYADVGGCFGCYGAYQPWGFSFGFTFGHPIGYSPYAWPSFYLPYYDPWYGFGGAYYGGCWSCWSWSWAWYWPAMPPYYPYGYYHGYGYGYPYGYYPGGPYYGYGHGGYGYGGYYPNRYTFKPHGGAPYVPPRGRGGLERSDPTATRLRLDPPTVTTGQRARTSYWNDAPAPRRETTTERVRREARDEGRRYVREITGGRLPGSSWNRAPEVRGNARREAGDALDRGVREMFDRGREGPGYRARPWTRGDGGDILRGRSEWGRSPSPGTIAPRSPMVMPSAPRMQAPAPRVTPRRQ